MTFARVPITSAQEYEQLQERGCDFCDGCGRTCLSKVLTRTRLETEEGTLAPGLVCSACWHVQREERQRRCCAP